MSHITHPRFFLAVTMIILTAIAGSAQRTKTKDTVLSKSTLMNVTSIQIADVSTSPSQTVTVQIEATAQGMENTFSFSINYDPTVFSAPIAGLGADTQTAFLTADTEQPGVVGISISLPEGQMLAAGARQIATVQFTVSALAEPGTSPLTIGDIPILCGVYDTEFSTVASSFNGGTITILGPTAAPVTVSGRTITASGVGISGARVVLTNMRGESVSTLTNPFGYYVFSGVDSGESYLVSVSKKGYSFTQSTMLVNAIDNVLDNDFVGVPL